MFSKGFTQYLRERTSTPQELLDAFEKFILTNKVNIYNGKAFHRYKFPGKFLGTVAPQVLVDNLISLGFRQNIAGDEPVPGSFMLYHIHPEAGCIVVDTVEEAIGIALPLWDGGVPPP